MKDENNGSKHVNRHALHRLSGVWVPRIFIDWCGAHTSAFLLAQLTYWTEICPKEDGWICKTKKQWEKETGLSRRTQESARRTLIALGFLEEESYITEDMTKRIRFRLTTKFYDFVAGVGTQETYPQAPRRPGVGTQETLCAHNARAGDRLHNKTTIPRGSGRGDGLEGFKINAEGKLFKLCKKYAQFAQARYGECPTDYIIQKRWVTEAFNVITTLLDGDKSHFIEILQWYMENVRTNNYLTECTSMPAFCKKFRQIEKAMRRSNGDRESAPRIIKRYVGPVKYV